MKPATRVPPVWLLAYTEQTVADCADTLRRAIGGRTQVLCAAVSRARPDELPRAGSRASAAVVVLESAGLADPRYLEILRWGVRQVARREDFRLFLYAGDVGEGEFIRRAGLGEGESAVLADLRDTVQLTTAADFGRACAALGTFVRRWQEIHDEAIWRALRLRGAVALGRAVALLQWLCLLLAGLTAFWLPVWDKNPLPERLLFSPGVTAVVCGIGSFPLVALGLFAVTRYGLVPLGIHAEGGGVLWAGLGFVLAPPLLAVGARAGAGPAWVLLGVVAGGLLDAARRAGLHARWVLYPIDITQITPKGHPLPDPLRSAAGRARPNPLRCPLLPVRVARVFISYTRVSPWAVALARKLRLELEAVGARPFLDAMDIGEGSSWRRALDDGLGRATVVVALVDPCSVHRPWTAAELEAALAGKHLTGLPEVIVIKAPDLPASLAASLYWLPAFSVVLHPSQEAPTEGRPQLLPDGPALLPGLGVSLHPDRYRSVAVVPYSVSEAFRLFWRGFRTVTGPARRAALLAGYLLAWPLALMGLWPGPVWSSGWSATAILVAAAGLGFLVRRALALRFELRTCQRGASVLHLGAALGYVAVLALGINRGPPVVLGWAVVLGVIGWLEAAALAGHATVSPVTSSRADGLSPEDL